MARGKAARQRLEDKAQAMMTRADTDPLQTGHLARAARSTQQRHGLLGSARTSSEFQPGDASHGRILAVEVISVCALLVSLVAVALCVRSRKRSIRAPRPGDYEDAMSTVGDDTLPYRRQRLDTQGYTEVDIVPETGVASPAPETSEYSRLGTENLARTYSAPVCSRKAYDHVILGTRSQSTGGKTSANRSAKVVTPHTNEYDVTKMKKARVEVIDEIYNKLNTGTG